MQSDRLLIYRIKLLCRRALCLTVVSTGSAMGDCLHDCRIDTVGVQFVRGAEGWSPVPYKDNAGYWTVGVGHRMLPTDKFSYPLSGFVITDLLQHDLATSEDIINHSVTVALEQHQFDPLCSLVFNIGHGVAGANGRDGFVITKAGEPSMILAALNRDDMASAADHFLDWRFAGGKPVLLGRRQKEREIFLHGT